MVAFRRRRADGGRVRPAIGRTLAVLLCLAACSAPARQPPSTTDPVDPCAASPTRESCASVEVSGHAQRYTLLRRGTTAETVVVDLGGPGLSLLGGVFHLASYGTDQPRLRRYNLLFLEEPWVTAPLADGCDTALTAYYRALRDAPARAAGTGAALRTACAGEAPGTWGFAPDRYAAALRAIAGKERLRLTGFVGYSFGDVRFSYARALDFRWAVFVRPYPLGVSGAEIVAARAEELADLLARARKLRTRPDATSAPRSLPVTEFDHLSAQVALSYLDGPTFADYGREVVDGSNPARIGALSDDLWKRYGTEQMSPGYLAYLDEVCRATPGWPAVGAIGTPADVIAASTTPCAAYPAEATSIDARTAVCVVTSDADPVLPARLSRRMLARHPAWRRVSTPTAEHASSDGLDTCLASLHRDPGDRP